MIRIRIESVGEVEVLQLAASISGTATVLVDLGDGFRDQFVTWTLVRRDYSVCVLCGAAVVKSTNDSDWYTEFRSPTSPNCPNSGGTRHQAASRGSRSEYHAVNGRYHGTRYAAEREFAKRADLVSAQSG